MLRPQLFGKKCFRCGPTASNPRMLWVTTGMYDLLRSHGNATETKVLSMYSSCTMSVDSADKFFPSAGADVLCAASFLPFRSRWRPHQILTAAGFDLDREQGYKYLTCINPATRVREAFARLLLYFGCFYFLALRGPESRSHHSTARGYLNHD